MNKIIYIVIAVILILAVIFAVYGISGQAIIVAGKFGTCIDSDGGDNPFVKGTASYVNASKGNTDFCTSKIKLKEYYCYQGNYKIKAKRYLCEKECLDGACVLK